MSETAIINKLWSSGAQPIGILTKTWAAAWKALSFSAADSRVYPEQNLSISIGSGSVSVAAGGTFLSKTKIKWLKHYSFDKDKLPEPKEVAFAAETAVRQFSFSKGTVTLSIPKIWAIVKTFDMPSSVIENLPDVISYELDRLTPFRSENAFYDFSVLGQSGDKVQIALIAASADTLRPYLNALKEKDINVQRITTNLSSTAALLGYAEKKNSGHSPLIVADIGGDNYECGLLTDNSLLAASSGRLDASDSRSAVTQLAHEIKSLAEIAGEKGISPSTVILLRDKNAVFKESLKIKLATAARVLDFDELSLSDRDSEAYSASGSVIESLSSGTKGLNLMSKGVRKSEKPSLFLTALLSLTIIALLVFYLIMPLRIEEKKLAEINRQISIKKTETKKVEDIRKEREALINEIETINRFKTSRPMTINILKDVTSVLPNTAWLMRLQITQSSVNLEGYASSTSGLLSTIESSKYFEKAEFAAPIYKDISLKADRFFIKTSIENPGMVSAQKAGNEKK